MYVPFCTFCFIVSFCVLFFVNVYCTAATVGRDSSDVIATHYELDGPGIES